MHTRAVLVALALTLSVGLAAPAGEVAPPPGGVAPTMKPLSEIEPRIAVNAVNTPGNTTYQHIISQPGSYYLEGNIAPTANRFGIQIAASDVTLDLNGFVIDGSATTSKSGITMLGGLTGAPRIRNGVVSNWDNYGIFMTGEGALVEDVTIRSCAGSGIQLPDRGTIRGCTLIGNGGNSIRAFDSCIITGCLIRTAGDAGIYAGSAGMILDNTIKCEASTVTGINSAGIWTRVEGNNVTGLSGSVGISAAANSLVARNTVSASITTPYSLHVSAKYGPIVTADGDLSGIVNADHPLANFVY